jgi:hypothetical protein
MSASDCPHRERRDGVCVSCGDCLHEVILNRACLYCGTTELDPIALSPKPPELIAPGQLVRRRG